MFNIFPRKILASEVTARRRAAVHGVQQVQLLDDARRGQIIRLAHRGSQTVILADAGAEGIHIYHDRVFLPDGIRQRDLTAVCKMGGDHVLAMYRAIYAPLRSTLVASLPLNAPPPWGANVP